MLQDHDRSDSEAEGTDDDDDDHSETLEAEPDIDDVAESIELNDEAAQVASQLLEYDRFGCFEEESDERLGETSLALEREDIMQDQDQQRQFSAIKQADLNGCLPSPSQLDHALAGIDADAVIGFTAETLEVEAAHLHLAGAAGTGDASASAVLECGGYDDDPSDDIAASSALIRNSLSGPPTT